MNEYQMNAKKAVRCSPGSPQELISIIFLCVLVPFLLYAFISEPKDLRKRAQ